MKINIPIKPKPTCLLAVVLLTMAAALATQAAALNGRVIPRPVTPGDVTTYALPASTENSGGILTVGVGTPVYLEADVNIAFPLSQITNVAFALAKTPIGSAAVIAASPLPANMGIYEPSDKLVYQVAGRALLRPDMTGQYTVTATIGTLTNGTTVVSNTITAGTYEGVGVCIDCHDGSPNIPVKYPYWTNTAHATIFTKGINGQLYSSTGQLEVESVSCLKCHTVGYDTNAASFADNGFFAMAHADGWTFPTVVTNSNWASMQANYPNEANLANIQCENCHGPGSEHLAAAGKTNIPSKITVSYTSGDCNQCHDAPTHHFKGTEWYASSHAVTTTIPSGAGRGYCVQCHTTAGFITRINYTGANSTNFAPTNTIDTTFSAIGCQTCHEPHGQTIPTNNPHLIRALAAVAMGDGTLITNAGEAELCLQCHHSRDGSATNNVVQYALGKPTYPGGSSFGPHDGVQGDMIEAVNAITYGQTFPSSAHRSTVTNVCVGCHMQTVAAGDPAFLHAGGHTFEMKYSVVTNGVTNVVDKTDVCAQCHGQIASFNFPVEDYDGDGVIEGVQTEVQNLLNKLSTLLPNTNGVVDGSVKTTTTTLSPKTTWTQAQLKAAYNWQFVNNDGSLGVHNAPFATGILKASIADLTGVSAAGGLPDAWEIQYFGSITNASGAPNASPAGDGIPNWLKYSLGLNPLVAGIQVSNGVVYANGTGYLGGSTNTIQIYTAADVTFNTVAGTTYQLQEVSSLGGGWQNVGSPILATNSASMSYLTPTRGNLQQYFRVWHNP
jgi:hypothetical protein